MEISELSQEIWRPVKDHEGLYEISSEGSVRSLNFRGKKGVTHILKQFKRHKSEEYLAVELYKDECGRIYNVHQLVAAAFPEICGKPFDGAVINHKDEDPTNNKATNLEYCTVAYNNTYGTIKERVFQTRVNKGLQCPYHIGTQEYRDYWNKRKKEYRKAHYIPHPRQKVKTADMAQYRRDYYRKIHGPAKYKRPVERTGKRIKLFLYEYSCFKEAAEAIGASGIGQISKACRGILKTAYGCEWRYCK